MQGGDLARVRADLAARRPCSVEQAAERAHRGRALVEAALQAARAGQPAPAIEVLPTPAPQRPPQRFEVVSCGRCYRPHEGLPGSLCPTCSSATQPLGDLVTEPTPHP